MGLFRIKRSTYRAVDIKEDTEAELNALKSFITRFSSNRNDIIRTVQDIKETTDAISRAGRISRIIMNNNKNLRILMAFKREYILKLDELEKSAYSSQDEIRNLKQFINQIQLSKRLSDRIDKLAKNVLNNRKVLEEQKENQNPKKILKTIKEMMENLKEIDESSRAVVRTIQTLPRQKEEVDNISF